MKPGYFFTSTLSVQTSAVLLLDDPLPSLLSVPWNLHSGHCSPAPPEAWGKWQPLPLQLLHSKLGFVFQVLTPYTLVKVPLMSVSDNHLASMGPSSPVRLWLAHRYRQLFLDFL